MAKYTFSKNKSSFVANVSLFNKSQKELLASSLGGLTPTNKHMGWKWTHEQGFIRELKSMLSCYVPMQTSSKWWQLPEGTIPYWFCSFCGAHGNIPHCLYSICDSKVCSWENSYYHRGKGHRHLWKFQMRPERKKIKHSSFKTKMLQTLPWIISENCIFATKDAKGV